MVGNIRCTIPGFRVVTHIYVRCEDSGLIYKLTQVLNYICSVSVWVYTYIIPVYTYIPQTVFTYTVGVLGDCLREWVSGFPGLSQVRALVKLCTAGIANGEGRSRLA